MSFKTLKELEKEKEAIAAIFYGELEDLYKIEIRKVFGWFTEHYPKRTLKWVSGMGTCFWVLDGEILHWDTLTLVHSPGMHYVDPLPDRKAEKLLPLWYFFRSINNVTHTLQYAVDLGDITMESLATWAGR